ncbi:MAG: sensor histidine kinase [Treponema sp.]|nr:sensor histidine kinase [Treponema sp.]
MKKILSFCIFIFCFSGIFAHNENSMQLEPNATSIQEEYKALRKLSYKDENLLPAVKNFRESLRLYKNSTNLEKEFRNSENRLYGQLDESLDNLISYLEEYGGTDKFDEAVYFQYLNNMTAGILALHDLSYQDLKLSGRKTSFLFQIFVLLFFMAVIAVIVLALSYKQSAHEKKVARQVNQIILQAQEDERKIISHELHDTIAQELKGIKFITSQLSSIELNADKTLELSKKADEIVSQAMTNVRSICYNLTPPELEYNKLSEAIILMSDSFSKQTSIECPVAVQCSRELDSLDSDRQIHIFRIIQECLTNIKKHSKANEASVIIRQEGNNIIILISDDGIGFDCNVKQFNSTEKQITAKHFGLLGIKDRVENIKGKLVISSEPDIGTSVKITVPVITK